MTPPNGVPAHYTVADLVPRILDALAASGKNVAALTPHDLAPVDAFHVRGRAATEELAAWIDLDASHRVIDVGSGIGGTSRYLAATFGCRCTGVDITASYCEAARALSAHVGLADRVTFEHASALELPFPDGAFDVAWTEHVQMNVADKPRFYGEIARVLAPGGRLVFHDLFAGEGGPVHFPVPWAEDSTISHLAPVAAVPAQLTEAGLTAIRWEDRTGDAVDFFRRRLAASAGGAIPPLGLHLLIGPGAGARFANLLASLEEDRVRAIQAVCRRQPL